HRGDSERVARSYVANARARVLSRRERHGQRSRSAQDSFRLRHLRAHWRNADLLVEGGDGPFVSGKSQRQHVVTQHSGTRGRHDWHDRAHDAALLIVGSAAQRRLVAPASAMLIILGAIAGAQSATISGRIVDGITGRPVGTARVAITAGDSSLAWASPVDSA